MSLGLRWEGQSKPIEVNHLNELPYDGDFNNFGPSLGLAVRLGEGWGALRAATVCLRRDLLPATAQQVRFNAPLNYKLAVQTRICWIRSAGVGEKPPDGTRSVLYDFSPDLATPYAHQYNFSWEDRPGRCFDGSNSAMSAAARSSCCTTGIRTEAN